MPNPKPVRIANLTPQIKNRLIRTQPPQLANSAHRFKNPFVTPDLHLRRRPKQTEILRIMRREPGHLGMTPHVRLQISLPFRGCFLRHNLADNDAAGVADSVCRSVGQDAAVLEDVGEVDLGDG